MALKKTPLLFLCHRIPYPPNKGDKIRSFHLLHHLCENFDIYLATFIDDPEDWPWVPEVEKFCAGSVFIQQKRWVASLKSLSGLLTGAALSIPFYASRQMHKWVRRTIQDNDIRHVMVFSSSMAQYALSQTREFERKVVDFVDVDSDKWQQYAKQKRWPMNWLYRREARCLLDYECRLAREFNAGLFVSASEADLFRQLSPATASKIGFYNNGVNSEYFDASEELQSPYLVDKKPVVFTGAMDYWPNIDAVVWFALEVLPSLRAVDPDIEFYIVGSNPAKTVRQLSSQPGVVVTGRVEDVRPYVRHARVAVAPMRVARGVQNKVLEAMSMGKPVLVSSKGLEGIDARHGEHLLVADTEAAYLDLIMSVIHGNYAELGIRARRFVVENFNWDNSLPEVALLLGHSPILPALDECVGHG